MHPPHPIIQHSPTQIVAIKNRKKYYTYVICCFLEYLCNHFFFFSLEKSSSIRLKKQEIAQKFSFSFWLEDGWSCGEKIAEIGGGGILLRPLLLSSDQYKKKSFPNWISWVFFYWGRRGSPSERKKIAHKLVFRPSTNVFSHKFNKVFVPSPNHPLDKNSACCTARIREFTSGKGF